MADDRRSTYQSHAAEATEYGIFGLGEGWGERIATSVVVSIAVMIVALIAVLMGMA